MAVKTKDFSQEFCSEEPDLKFLNLSPSTLFGSDEYPRFVTEESFDSDADISQVNCKPIHMNTK